MAMPAARAARRQVPSETSIGKRMGVCCAIRPVVIGSAHDETLDPWMVGDRLGLKDASRRFHHTPDRQFGCGPGRVQYRAAAAHQIGALDFGSNIASAWAAAIDARSSCPQG